MCNLRSVIVRVLFDDDGQDLVEYALLTGIVGLAGLAAYGLLRDNMAEAYNNWTAPDIGGSPGQEIWIPLPPQ